MNMELALLCHVRPATPTYGINRSMSRRKCVVVMIGNIIHD